MYCAQCGRPVADDARYCVNCGAVVPRAGEASATPSPVSPYAPVSTPASPPVSPYTPASTPAMPYTPAAASPYAPTGATAAPSLTISTGATSAPGGTPDGGYGGAPRPPEASTPFGAAPGVGATSAALHSPFAGFWRRFWGLFVDRFLIGVVLLPVGIAMGLGFFTRWNGEDFTPQRLFHLLFGSMVMFSVRALVEWLYFAGMQSSTKQATLGQMMLGVQVTDLGGGRISFGRATGRYLASWLSAAILCIGFLMAVFTERKQALHDLIAGTLVVRS